MPRRVWRDALGGAGLAAGLPAGPSGSVPAEVAAGDHAGEQPLACGPHAPPVVAQSLQQARGEHDVAVLAALALLDADHHELAVDVGRAQADGLGDSKFGRVAGGQDDSGVEDGDGIRKGDDLLGAGDHRQLGGLLGCGQDLGNVPVLLQRDAVQEAQSGDGHGDRTGSEALPGGEMNLICADLLGTEQFRGLAEVAGEQRDLPDMGVQRAEGRMRTCMPSAMVRRRGVMGPSGWNEWHVSLVAACPSFRTGGFAASPGPGPARRGRARAARAATLSLGHQYREAV